jgi:hypothetical protein
MAASDNLSEALFHGTKSELKPGDIISHENSPRSVSHKGRSYATRNRKVAQAFAGENGRVYRVKTISNEPEHTWWQNVKGMGNAQEIVSTKGFEVISESKPRKKKTSTGQA